MSSIYLSPANPGAFIWGVGPSVTMPTATTHIIGAGKLSVGPAAVGLLTPKPWVVGMLVRQLWSVAGPNGRADVNQTLLQPFVNYNIPEGWYLTSSPIITANWQARSGQQWSVPVGGGVGKIFKIAGQPLNTSLQFYDYAVRTPVGPEWAIRFQMTLLFPR